MAVLTLNNPTNFKAIVSSGGGAVQVNSSDTLRGDAQTMDDTCCHHAGACTGLTAVVVHIPSYIPIFKGQLHIT